MQTITQILSSEIVEIILLPAHIIILVFIFWNIFQADSKGISWIKGKIEKLNADEIKKFHHNIFYGLVGMTFTGIGLFIPEREELSDSVAFKFKMALVGVLFINSFIIYKLMPVASEKKYSELTNKEKLPLVISGVVSTLSWIFVLVAVMYFPD